jgi:hypothetical protein
MNDFIPSGTWNDFIGLWLFYVLCSGLMLHGFVYIAVCLLMALEFRGQDIDYKSEFPGQNPSTTRSRSAAKPNSPA